MQSVMAKRAILWQRGRGQRSEVAKAHDDRAFPFPSALPCAAGHLCLWLWLPNAAVYVRHLFRIMSASTVT